MRRLLVLAVVLGVALVPLALSLATADHHRAREDQRRDLTAAAAHHAAQIEGYIGRSQDTARVTAAQPAVIRAAAAPGPRAVREARGSLRVLEASPRIELVRLLRADGRELARVVDGRAARPGRGRDLSWVGAPALRTQLGRPSRSPDLRAWVIGISTPVPAAGGAPDVALQFEVPLEVMREVVGRPSDQYDLLLVDRSTGRALIDASRPVPTHARLAVPGVAPFGPAELRTAEGLLERDGHAIAYARTADLEGDANDFVVVARSRTAVPSLLDLRPLPLTLLAVAALLLAVGAAGLHRYRRRLVRDASRDALTGLANRRKLDADLARLFERPVREAQALVMFDLDGFKNYNDTFGHLGGDALLRRLSTALRAAVAPFGHAYRLGGDEFCVLCGARDLEAAVAAAHEALTERGDGFAITATHGAVLVPAEATAPGEALRIADERMYAGKTSGRVSAERQTTDALLRAQAAARPALAEVAAPVAHLAEGVARRLGLPDDEVVRVRRASELRDVGMLSVPEAIVAKPGPLDPDEWAFVRRHSAIGERIVAAAPALVPTARLVRAVHERWDGRGYPDALAGEEIPLGARVIAACDAYAAMLSPRPHRDALTHDAALAELRRVAGTQLDPGVVAALEAELAQAPAAAAA